MRTVSGEGFAGPYLHHLMKYLGDMKKVSY
jgi:hypothetical protein